jgi:type I restriction enzyme R subunit
MFKAESAAIAKPGEVNLHRADIIEWVNRLPPHLNPVRAKAADLIAIRSDAFWVHLTFASLDGMRESLRELMKLADAPPQLPPALVTRLDVKEDAAEYRVEERATNIQSIDFEIFRKSVQSALEPLFESDPVLQKIRRGEFISSDELGTLNSLLHTRNPNVDLSTLKEFFPGTAASFTQILSQIVGLDHGAVEAKFTAFAQSYSLNSQQLRFLAMLKDHIRQFGAIAVAQLFDAPFNTLHTEGLGGVFPNPAQLDELVELVRGFGEPFNRKPITNLQKNK